MSKYRRKRRWKKENERKISHLPKPLWPKSPAKQVSHRMEIILSYTSSPLLHQSRVLPQEMFCLPPDNLHSYPLTMSVSFCLEVTPPWQQANLAFSQFLVGWVITGPLSQWPVTGLYVGLYYHTLVRHCSLTVTKFGGWVASKRKQTHPGQRRKVEEIRGGE